MKVFVYEHITSGALINEHLPASLSHEGNEMLRAIVHDMAKISDLELIILRDKRLAPFTDMRNTAQHCCYIINNNDEFQHYYTEALDKSDAVLVIAPETEGLLQKIQQSVLDKGKQLLGCFPSAIQICSDKVLSHQQLQTHKLSTPNTILASNYLHQPFNSATGFIIKPRDGAGCIDTLFVDDTATLQIWLSTTDKDLEQFIIQPYIQGMSISLTALFDENDSRVLAINHQYIKLHGGRFSFHGCNVNSITETDFSQKQADVIAQNIHKAISGLWGFIGIDLIIADNEVYIVDINPRLTTAYVGLHQSINLNPAKLLLTMMEQGLSALPTTIQRQAIEVLL